MSEFINNQSLRKEKLKEALLQIHEGKPYQEVKAVFKDILSKASAGEIAEIEQALIACTCRHVPRIAGSAVID
jgi:DUF438 domain-containing protein